MRSALLALRCSKNSKSANTKTASMQTARGNGGSLQKRTVAWVAERSSDSQVARSFHMGLRGGLLSIWSNSPSVYLFLSMHLSIHTYLSATLSVFRSIYLIDRSIN